MALVGIHFWKSMRHKDVEEWIEVGEGIKVKVKKVVWENPEEYKRRKPDRLTICILNKCFTIKIPFR